MNDNAESSSKSTITHEFDDTWRDRQFGDSDRKKGWLEWLAGKCARHPWLVIAIWVALAVGSGIYSRSLHGSLTTELQFYGDKDSYHAELATEKIGLGSGDLTSELILVRSKNPDVTVTSDAFVAKAKAVEEAVKEKLGNVENTTVATLSLKDLEDGVVIRPSVIGRETILQLVEDKKAEVTAKYEQEGDELKERGDKLEQRGKELAEHGAAVQAALTNALGVMATTYGMTPQKLAESQAQIQQVVGELQIGSQTEESAPTGLDALTPEQLQAKADAGDIEAIARIAQQKADATQTLFNETKKKADAGDEEAKQALPQLQIDLDSALKTAKETHEAVAKVKSGSGVVVGGSITKPETPEALSAQQKEEKILQQAMGKVYGRKARSPEFIALLAQMDDLQNQAKILEAQGKTLQTEVDQLKKESDDLKRRADNEKADGEAQQADLDSYLDQLVSHDDQATIVIASFNRTESQVPIERWVKAIEKLSDDTFQVTSIGIASINKAFSEDLNSDLIKAELIGVPIALLVMVYVFRSFAGPLVPLLLGVIAIFTARGVVTGIASISTQQIFIENIVSMLGLAIGIDYALFVVQRFNENIVLGHGRIRAIERASATSGKAVVFSGFTVAVSLSGVMLVPANIFSSLGLGAIIIVIVALLAVTTLLPAILAVYGGVINWPFGKRASMQQPITRENIFEGFWGKTTKLSVTHPWKVMLTSVAILLALAYPIFGMKMGFSSALDIERGVISQEWDYMQEEFAPGMLAPYEFVVTGDKAEAAVNELIDTFKDDESIHSFGTAQISDDGKGAYVEAIGAKPQATLANYDRITDWRNNQIIDIENTHGVEIHIGGQAAAETDMLSLLGPTTPWVFALVLSLSFVLLMVAFRSIVVPLKAMIYNILSVSATYGIMMIVFKHGFLIDLLGYHHRPLVEAWLPIMLFCILFGLSMDYHVFILSRIREHYDISHENKESVTVGLRATSRLITGAAAIMVVIFLAFSFSSSIQLQQFGFGLAVAVFLDATLIRVFLVPSLMVLMREANWWLPRWLNWLPDLRIEGDPEDSAIVKGKPVYKAHDYSEDQEEETSALSQVKEISNDDTMARFLGLETAETMPPPPGKLPPPPQGPKVTKKPGSQKQESWEDLFGIED